MHRGTFLLVALVALTIAAGASAQIGPPPPPSWSLSQNDPDPFCGSTAIQFGVPQAAHVQLAVWDADQTAIVGQLIDRMLPVGFHSVVWDGRDNQGEEVPDGQYPYRLVAQVDGVTVYDSSLVLQIQCNVAAEEGTWGAVKSLYGR